MILSLKRLSHLFLATLLLSLGCYDGCSCDSDSDLIGLIAVGKPTFSTARGTNYDVTMHSSTPGATIKYTTDGSDPRTSETAIVGNSVRVGLLTTIKAYAYRLYMEDSEVSAYNVPWYHRNKYVKYTSDGEVDFYYIYEYDCNDKIAIEIYFMDNGDDSRWFNDDDTIDYFKIYEYDEDGLLAKDIIFTNSGDDGEWLTTDDSANSYCAYTYDEGSLIKMTTFGSDDSVDHYFMYDYNDEGLLSIKTRHNSDDTINCYYTFSYNAESQKERQALYNSDDAIQHHITYGYNAGGNLVTEVKYNGPGGDGEWLTGGDDVVENYSAYEYNGDNMIERVISYNGYGDDETWFSDDDAVDHYFGYSYINVDHYYTYEYDAEGNRIREARYLEYGTDTMDYYFTNEYEGNDLTIREKRNIDGSLDYYYAYEYDSEGRRTREEKRGSNNAMDYYYLYSYDGDRLTKKEKRGGAGEGALDYFCEYDYTVDGKITRESTFINPGPNTRTIRWNITIRAGIEDGGYFTITGVNYDVDGLRLGDVIEGDPDDSDFLVRCLEKARGVINNCEISETGITVHGGIGGYCEISAIIDIDFVTRLTIAFDFNDYNDGAGIFNGVITKYLEAHIEYDGSFDSSAFDDSYFDGTFVGELTVTDTNPSWSEEDFTQDSYVIYEYSSANGELERQIKYKDPGMDGSWGDDSDNCIEYYIAYEYNEDDDLELETVYNDPGDDGEWFAGDDDVIESYYTYTYESDNLARRTMYREYGTCITLYNGPGDDDEWFIGNDDSVDYSTFEFEYED